MEKDTNPENTLEESAVPFCVARAIKQIERDNHWLIHILSLTKGYDRPNFFPLSQNLLQCADRAKYSQEFSEERRKEVIESLKSAGEAFMCLQAPTSAELQQEAIARIEKVSKSQLCARYAEVLSNERIWRTNTDISESFFNLELSTDDESTDSSDDIDLSKLHA